MTVDIDTKQATASFAKYADTRRVTDKFFILLLPLNLLICFAIGINVLCDEKVSANIWQDLTWYFRDFIVYGVITTVVIILLAITLNTMKNDWLVFVIIFSIFIIISSFLTHILWKLSTMMHLHDYELDWWLFMYAIVCITCLVYNVIILICTRELGEASLGPMIKETIRAILHFYTVSLFSLTIIFLMACVFVITFPTAIRAAGLYIRTRNMDLLFIRLNLFTFIIGGMFILDFIWSFGYMVMGNYFANYYNRHDVLKTYIFQSIATVSRYHLGTVAFLSTPILPRVCALVMFFKNNHQHGEPSNYKLINCISKMSLIMNMPEYALIQTSIFGSNSLKSKRQMVELRHKNSLLFLTLNAVSIKIMDISMTIAIIIIWIVIQNAGIIHYYINGSLINNHEFFGMDIVYQYLVIWFYVNTISTLLLRPAACTFTVCKMIDAQHE